MPKYFRKYNYPHIIYSQKHIYSNHLRRNVIFDTYTPNISKRAKNQLPTIVFNDGQTLQNMEITKILRKLLKNNRIRPCIVVGVHSTPNRHHELGTTQYLQSDGNGILAQAYQEFIINELIPRLQFDNSDKFYIAGFSLGGLSALDITLNHPKTFSGVGVFSGALWWRDKPFSANHPNANLIIPRKIQSHQQVPNTQYWFQTGSLDEDNDRDKNGIIDVIDDTLRTIVFLQHYRVEKKNISYVEIKGGKHHWQTWAKAMPKFLMTIFGS